MFCIFQVSQPYHGSISKKGKADEIFFVTNDYDL